MRGKKQLRLYTTSTYLSKKDSPFDHSVSVIPSSYHITNDHQLAEQLIGQGRCRFRAIGILCKLAKLLAALGRRTDLVGDGAELDSMSMTDEYPYLA
jgi:hypothetical protein